MSTTIVWLRQDLRIADNPALFHACQSAERVLVVYIFAPDELAPWALGGASRWWLHHSLLALQGELERRGATLVIRAGPSVDVLRDLIATTGAEIVYANALYEPAAAKRDEAISNSLKTLGVSWQTYHASVLFQPGTVVNKQQAPYRVFTPFWRACLQILPTEAPLPTPSRIITVNGVASLTLDQLELLPKIKWAGGLDNSWQPGENAAHAMLDTFCNHAITDYSVARDVPGVSGTSRLSPYLHFGEISPRQIAWRLMQYGESAGASAHAQVYLRELGWREFAVHILHFFPTTTDVAMDKRFSYFPWRNDEHLFNAWKKGETGFPIIDAGMRELWNTGWMHNRVRMIVASFLTKNCLLPWQGGARWFWDTLVDADLASNSMGWQWVAGSGVDAAPYFRIFNPITQSKKFDPEGNYLRRWVPELASLPNRHIHEPWLASEFELASAAVIMGKTYPRPILDLAETRAHALDVYRSLGDYTRV